MNKVPQTVAIIMDGNGRWAKAKGLPRTAGHKQGAEQIRVIAMPFLLKTGKDQKMKFAICVNCLAFSLAGILKN